MTGWPVLEIELLWIVLFSTRIWPIHAYPNHLSQQILAGWMHLKINAALRCLLAFPYCRFHTAVSFAMSSLRFPSWPHSHQTPSLCPFRADVVEPQMQLRQGWVLLKGLGQGLAGDTWLERHEWSTQHASDTANMQKSHHSSSHP